MRNRRQQYREEVGELSLLEKINALIEKEYESVRGECSTYGELKDNLQKVEKEIAWNDPELALYIKRKFQATVNREIGGLSLKQRPPTEL